VRKAATTLWTAADAAAATGGELAGDGRWNAGGVSIDSRGLARGDLLVALLGENRDGHRFVAAALEAGAAAAVVSRPPEGLPAGASLLVVADTQAALEALGRAGRARSPARVAAVTGSVGKTGTKEALRHVLRPQGPTHASASSHNNHWGVPLSLARLPREAAYGVFELGMNHAGEIAALTRQVRPHAAMVTLIAPAHLGHFASLDEIADAKGEIFAGLEPGGTAVLNRDDEHLERLRGHAERAGAAAVVTFGAGEGADWRLLDARMDPLGSDVAAERRGRPLRYRLGVPGRHWVQNSLGVLAAAEALGADPEAAARELATLEPPAGRGLRRPIAVLGGDALLLDESYNANPASMAAALELLGQMPGRRIAVLGDMLELGERGPELHAALAEPLARAGVACLFSCGPLMAALQAALPAAVRGVHASDSASLVEELAHELRPGDAVLVKGSLGSRMGLIVEALTRGGGSAPSRRAPRAGAR
jgi:UDP-N-acetylmuramoyl-tripeptide--D-alanyl-D-alanine ligase